jgi:hypothetical protein
MAGEGNPDAQTGSSRVVEGNGAGPVFAAPLSMPRYFFNVLFAFAVLCRR